MRIFLTLSFFVITLHLSGQNIGIGTTNPTAQLHISGNTTQEFILENTNTAAGGRKWGLVSLAANAGLTFQIVDQNVGIFRLGIDNNGRVGIGSPAPSALLDVAGDALINGVVVGRGNNGDITNTALGPEVLKNIGSGASANSSVGYQTMKSNISGVGNSVIGYKSLTNNTSGNYNTALGINALIFNTTGSGNVAIGPGSGMQNNGNYNVFVGGNAGQNTTGDYNTIIGTGANSLPNAQNSTAIGANSYVSQNNSIVLGAINGVNGATEDTKVGIGTTAPTTSLDVNGGIRTGFSGSRLYGFSSTGIQSITLSVGTLPADWTFSNTILIVNNTDGPPGIIRQAKLINSTTIQLNYDASAIGTVRFNYVFFKL